MSRIARSAIILPGVELGEDVVVEDFCVIGVLPRGHEGPPPPTRVGSGAVIRSHTVIYAGNQIGDGFHAGHKVNIREFNTIGEDVSVGTMSVIEHTTVIEAGVRFHTGVFIPELTTVRTSAWVGPHVCLTNSRYPATPNSKASLEGPVLGVRCRIGAAATILPGVTVGDEALVGAGSLVAEDVPARAVVYGNPARVQGSIDELEGYR